MPRLPNLILLTLATVAMSCHHNNSQIESKATANANWKKIPDSWIKSAIQFTYKKRDTSLISDFAKLIKPDTLFNPHAEHIDPDFGLVFNSVSVDLDGDQNNELICIQGWDVYYPYLCVFKQMGNSWYLIYMEDINTFYESPTLYIASNYSKNKTFYLRRVYDHGSGLYVDGYSFYKLTDDHVYKCLDIINNVDIFGWDLYLNQSIRSSIEFSGDYSDHLSVDYSYSFFPGRTFLDSKTDCPGRVCDNIPLIKGEDNVCYIYNNEEHKYKLDISSFKDTAEDLTAEKIACFANIGNDSLFIKAFRRQIDATLKTGAPIQKKILRKYLQLAARFPED